MPVSTAGVERVDGRNARRDRNTEAVLDAVHDLFVEGLIFPSVDDVARRSGVQLRSVHRYFDDVDALIRAAISRRLAVADPLFVLPGLGEGPFEERVEAYVAHRLELGTAVAPSARAALARASTAPLIAEQVDRRLRQLRRETGQHFAPEAAPLGEPRAGAGLACVDTLAQFESIENLRVRRRMSAVRTQRALVQSITAILRPGGG